MERSIVLAYNAGHPDDCKRGEQALPVNRDETTVGVIRVLLYCGALMWRRRGVERTASVMKARRGDAGDEFFPRQSLMKR